MGKSAVTEIKSLLPRVGVGGNEWLPMGTGLLLGDKKTLELDSCDGCTTVNIPKVIELHTLYEWITWNMNYIPIKLLNFLKDWGRGNNGRLLGYLYYYISWSDCWLHCMFTLWWFSELQTYKMCMILYIYISYFKERFLKRITRSINTDLERDPRYGVEKFKFQNSI